MRANIGFLLIGLGLIGAYIALGGKFATGQGLVGASSGTGKSPKTADQVGIANMGNIQAGGAHQPANVPFIPEATNGGHETPKDPLTNAPVGSGGMSFQSRLTQLGHIVAIQPMDRHASRGGMR